MEILLVCICILSVLMLIILFFLHMKEKNNKLDLLNDRFSKRVNIVSLISTIFCILALFISGFGLLMQIRKPKLQIEIYTIRGVTWEVENGVDELCLSYDYDEHVDFAAYTFHWWLLHIKNNGNSCAENVKIQISFSDFEFVSEPENYVLVDYNYAGTCNTLEYNIDKTIQPGEEITIPQIPFKNARLIDKHNTGYTYMYIKIYEDNSLTYQEEVYIKIIDNDMLEEGECFHSNKKYEGEYEQLIKKLNEYYFNNENYIYNYGSLNNFELYPPTLVFSTKEYEDVYKYYLNLINVYNPNLRKSYNRLAVFYGRLYYRSLCESNQIEINIEQAIFNDISVEKNETN